VDTLAPRWTVQVGNSLDLLRTLPDNSVDAIVCDPPYELGFMGKAWDSSGIAYSVPLWTEALRALKPGGHLLAFGGSRTYHRLAVAIEDAGFQIRDSLVWIYGSGFPKSLDVSTAIDKAAGAEREVIGSKRGVTSAETGRGMPGKATGIKQAGCDVPITAPATDAAKAWSGWGTALKPAQEPIVMGRKPLAGTIAETVLQYGTGAINVDGCRVPGALDGDPTRFAKTDGGAFASFSVSPPQVRAEGRWPANVLLGHSEACGDGCAEGCPVAELGDFARFFYTAKPSTRERDAGLEHLPTRAGHEVCNREEGSAGADNPRAGIRTRRANTHPTVKPIEIMRYLVRLVTPPGGLVLDPFTGSGTTGAAAMLEGVRFLGMELSPEYAEIARARIAYWEGQREDGGQLSLLDRANASQP